MKIYSEGISIGYQGKHYHMAEDVIVTSQKKIKKRQPDGCFYFSHLRGRIRITQEHLEAHIKLNGTNKRVNTPKGTSSNDPITPFKRALIAGDLARDVPIKDIVKDRGVSMSVVYDIKNKQ